MGLLEPMHLLIIGIVLFVIFGPKRIPELMRGLGKGMGELQKGIAESKRTLNEAMEEVQRQPPEPIRAEPKSPEHAEAIQANAETPKGPAEATASEHVAVGAEPEPAKSASKAS